MALLVPTPDVKPDLRTAQDGPASMNRLLVAHTILIKIRPEDRITLDRLERYTLIVALALYETTPSLIEWLLQPREVGLRYTR